MRKTNLITLLWVMLPLLGCSVGSIQAKNNTYVKATTHEDDKIITKSFEVDPFTQIKASTNILVIYTQGDKHSVIAKGPKNIVEEKFVCKSKEGVLNLNKGAKGVKFLSINNDENDRVTVYVTSKTLNSIKASSSAQFECKQLTEERDLNISSTSGADVRITQTKCRKLTIEASSGGTYRLYKVEAEEGVEASASSGSNVTIDNITCELLALETSTAGDLLVVNANCNMSTVESKTGSNIKVTNLKADKITLKGSGGGDVNTTVDCKELAITMTTGSSCRVTGTAKAHTVTTKTGGKADTTQLKQ